MQILLALIIGAVIGTAAHFTVGGRSTRGVALAPILGAFVSAVPWLILTWLGVGVDTLWPWLSAIVLPVVVVFPTLTILARVRAARDEAEKKRLKIA